MQNKIIKFLIIFLQNVKNKNAYFDKNNLQERNSYDCD